MELISKLSQYDEILQKKCFGHLSTISSDGKPHTAPLWIYYVKKNGLIEISIKVNSIKDKNITKNPNICLSVADPDNPYYYVQIKGEVMKKWVLLLNYIENILIIEF